MALKHKQLLHRIATWVATSPQLNSATDGLVMWAVWRKYQGQIEKRDLPFIVDRLIRTLREMVKLDALEAASNGKPTFHLPKRRRRQMRSQLRISPPAIADPFDHQQGERK